jgi:arsenate reductase
MITIYHNPRCKKSRAGLEYLQTKTADFEVKHYLNDDVFTMDALTDIIKKIKKNPIEMIRTQEAYYKQNMKGKSLSPNDIIRLMVENPKLIIRPIIVKEEKAVWGDPVENIEELF